MEDKNFNHILHRCVPPSLEDKDHAKKLYFASEGQGPLCRPSRAEKKGVYYTRVLNQAK